MHLGGAALSFAARPRETLFRITGLWLANGPEAASTERGE